MKIETDISAKIWMTWNITTYYLKLYRHKYMWQLEDYNFYALNIIDFFRWYEHNIKIKNIKITKEEYKKNLNDFINNLQKVQ